MSDNWITLIPEDPRFVPSEERSSRALDRFRKVAPESDNIEIKKTPDPTFYDCGANSDSVFCPRCTTKIEIAWWQERMNEDFEKPGFRLATYLTPCCGEECTLNDLNYDWHQGFACFGIEAMNPRIGEVESGLIKEFEDILGTPLRVIYQHI
jgi:hypothetical protein